MRTRVLAAAVAFILLGCSDNGKRKTPQRAQLTGEQTLALPASNTGGFDWGGDCSAGDDAFEAFIPRKSVTTIGDIPPNKRDVRIQLRSPADTDVQLIDEATGDEIIAWPGGLLSGPGEACTEYQGVQYCYSGYNGVDGDLGNEWIEVRGDTNRTLTMRAFGYAAGDANVHYSWRGVDTCNEKGDGSFGQFVPKNAVADVGQIPRGKVNVNIRLVAPRDADVQLYDDTVALVQWPDGRLSGSSAQSLQYEGMTIEWSGYNGDGTGYGHEYIRIRGEVTRELTMRVFGYAASQADVTYSWGEGAGDACTLSTDCAAGLACKTGADSAGACHTAPWCDTPESAGADCANMTPPTPHGTWNCEQFLCVWTADTGGGGGGPCPPDAYADYLGNHPDIHAATFGRLSADGQTDLCAALHELEQTGGVTVSEPAASANCQEPTNCAYITPTEEERTKILAAKYAHALWLDRQGAVPWNLSDYTPSELDGLFDPQVVFRNGTHFMSVVDFSPTQAWAYVQEQNLAKDSIESSINAVIGDLRSTASETDFIHGIGGGENPDPVNTAYTLDEALRTWVDRGFGTEARISRKGCHTMSRITLALLRSMNIPGVEVHNGTWYQGAHSTATWPVLNTAVAHGDHLYSASLRSTPTAELRIHRSFYEDPANTSVCGNDAGCLGNRHAALNALAYPAAYTTRRCCDPQNYGHDSCEAYLSSNYETFLSAAEIASAAATLSAACTP